jgi:Fur family ferric uptake transcriptional regulator
MPLTSIAKVMKPSKSPPSVKPSEKPREDFISFLGGQRLRVTNQRMAIFEAAFHRKDHFTAEDLLDDARALDDSVSRATIYRSLPILVGSGIVREVDVGRDHKYYMTTRDQSTFQAQLVCVNCDKIVEVDAPFMEWYGKTVAVNHNMEIVSQRLQVLARCSRQDCDNKKKK